ncbi:MAG: prepilin-type cleavage/methylation domain-containing protein, partial [Burkholderiaceae bacterium]|nr:prepilin-type cleavage/methylation domain-containing protein [Burkholderiaceae bacterium]
TLLEALVVVSIIAVGVTIAMSSYEKYIERVRVATAVNDMITIAHAIKEFELDNRRLPLSLDEVRMGQMRDPWKNAYRYLNLQVQKGKGAARKRKNLSPLNSDFDLYSVGKDGASVSSLMAKASRDDVVRALDGRFMGLASSLDP